MFVLMNTGVGRLKKNKESRLSIFSKGLGSCEYLFYPVVMLLLLTMNISYLSLQSKLINFQLDGLVPSTTNPGGHTLSPNHISDIPGYNLNKQTIKNIRSLNISQREDFAQHLINKYRSPEVVQNIFKSCGISLPVLSKTTSSNIIVLPFCKYNKEKTRPSSLISSLHMTKFQVEQLGYNLSPVSFFSNRNTLDNIRYYQDKYKSIFGAKLDKRSLLDVIQTAVFLVNDHTVQFLINDRIDKRGYARHIFYNLVKIGCKGVIGSKKKCRSFISALDVPSKLKDFVSLLPSEYVDKVLLSFDPVFCYEITAKEGLHKSKSAFANQWREAVKEWKVSIEDKPVYQLGVMTSISHSMKMTEEGLMNRENIRGISLNKDMRQYIRMTSCSGSLDSVVEVDTAGAYMNQLRVSMGMEPIEDPYSFLPVDRAISKDLCLRLICGSPKRARMHLINDLGISPTQADHLISLFFQEYPGFDHTKKHYVLFNHQQQLAMIEMYKLAAQHKMTFISNCDGIIVAKSDAILAKALYQQSWNNVLDQNMPVKVKGSLLPIINRKAA